jgi:hypothetical protein
MGYTTEFIDDGRGMIHTGEGVLTGEDLIAGSMRLRAEMKRGGRVEYAMSDLSAVTEMRATPDDLRQLAEAQLVTAQILPKALAAVVAPHDHVFGMARMWEAYADATGWETRVFRDRASADRWLEEQITKRRAKAAQAAREH